MAGGPGGLKCPRLKALIKVGYACNENCAFCHTLEVRHVDGPTAETDAKIRRAKALGHSMVVLSGGEPTIRPELLHWARLTASLDMDFGLVTNGQALVYTELVDKLLEQRLRYVYLSLHGGTRKVHNLMVRGDAFDAAFGAIKNLSGRGIDLSVNCVITKHNLAHLEGLVDLLLPYPDVLVKFSMVEPKGGGKKLFDHLIPPVADVARRVHEAITYGREKAGPDGPRFAHGGLPLCLMGEYADAYDDLKTHQYWTMIEVGEPDFFPVDDENKVHPEACEGCALRGPCPGLYRAYAERFGDVELTPVRDRPRSNSFNYRFEDLVTLKARDGVCPLREDGVTPWDRGRHLFVRHGERIGRYRADTRDFSDGEIKEIKHELGQVYVDVSRKDAPDDFRADLVKLERSPMCADCPEHDHCTGMFEPNMNDVFGRDDQEVVRRLEAMSGKVLDLGCGEAPYATALDTIIRSGQVDYTGVDPDAKRLAQLQERWPNAATHCARAEEYLESIDALDAVDHVLVLRSWNHLADPESVVEALVRRMAPGAQLLVVDNVAFGLARTAGQTQRGEGSSAELEHYRNDGAAQAAAVLDAAGLELVDRVDVTPERSNQWLLCYRKPAAAQVDAMVS